MEEGQLIESTISTTLDLPPSCIEFSPLNPELFMVGTYNLEKDDEAEVAESGSGEADEDEEQVKEKKKKQERNGSLMLWKLEADRLSEPLTMLHTVTHPSAILDIHFSPFNPSIFALAGSTGSISLYRLETEPRPHIALFTTYQLFDESTLVLSLAWHPSHPHLLGCTLNTSSAALISLSEDFTAAEIARENLSPHDGLEAWTLAFAPPVPGPKTMPQALYTGGDDSKLRCLRFPSLASLKHPLSEIEAASPGGPRGMRGHEAGVTAILPLPLGTEAGKDLLLTGSYDDFVRVYAVHDYREGQSNAPKVLLEKKLGGGVWRLKFLDRESEKVVGGKRTFKVLASCMHAGSRVLEVTGELHGEWEIKVLARWEENESMNYGSDVQPMRRREWRGVQKEEVERENDKKDVVIVSTSFYDRRLAVWKMDRSLFSS